MQTVPPALQVGTKVDEWAGIYYNYTPVFLVLQIEVIFFSPCGGNNTHWLQQAKLYKECLFQDCPLAITKGKL